MIKNTIIKKHAVSCFLKASTDTYVFQLRSNIETIPNPGIISVFGGRIEINESPIDAIMRELKEELDLTTAAEKFKFLGYAERYDEKFSAVTGILFFIYDSHVSIKYCNEGELVFLSKNEILFNANVGHISRDMFLRSLLLESI